MQHHRVYEGKIAGCYDLENQTLGRCRTPTLSAGLSVQAEDKEKQGNRKIDINTHSVLFLSARIWTFCCREGRTSLLHRYENDCTRKRDFIFRFTFHITLNIDSLYISLIGEKVAVKVIDKTKLDEVSKAHLFQEVR